MRKLIIGLACLFVAGCGANSTTDTSTATTVATTSASPTAADFEYIISVAPDNKLEVTTKKGLPATQLNTTYDYRFNRTVSRWGINEKPTVHVTGIIAFCAISNTPGAIVSEVKKENASDITCYVP